MINFFNNIWFNKCSCLDDNPLRTLIREVGLLTNLEELYVCFANYYIFCLYY